MDPWTEKVHLGKLVACGNIYGKYSNDAVIFTHIMNGNDVMIFFR